MYIHFIKSDGHSAVFTQSPICKNVLLQTFCEKMYGGEEDSLEYTQCPVEVEIVEESLLLISTELTMVSLKSKKLRSDIILMTHNPNNMMQATVLIAKGKGNCFECWDDIVERIDDSSFMARD